MATTMDAEGKNSKEMVRDWAQLPGDLVDAISQRLPVLSAITMGRVCKPWMRVLGSQLPLTRSRGLPWFLLTAHNQMESRPCYSLLQKNSWSLQLPNALGKYCWGSIHDWLIIAHKCHLNLEIYLFNPFTRTKLYLPSVRDSYTKMILSSSPDDPNCVFLLLDISNQSIACWTPGVENWRVQRAGGRPFDDAVFCNDRFYFLTHDYNIQTLDLHTLISTLKQDKENGDLKLHLHPHQVAIPEEPTRSNRPLRLYLVESCGEVLMVCRLFLSLTGDRRVTQGFEVLKLDQSQMVWRKMESLGDRVLFLGRSDSRSFSSKDLGDEVANHIYFFNDFFTIRKNEWTRNYQEPTTTPPIRHCTVMDWGAFSMDTKGFIPNKCNHGSLLTYPPIWITAPTWWFFTAFSNNKHHPRTGLPEMRTGQQQKKRKSCPPEKRRRITAAN